MIEYPCRLGGDICAHYREMARKAKEDKKTYYFEGNGIIFIADSDSDVKLADKFLGDCYTYKVKVLGPDMLRLNEDYKKEMEKIREEESKKFKEEIEKEKKRYEENKQIVLKVTKDEQLMLNDSLEYEGEYEKNAHHFYSRTVFLYAEDLMKLLQIRKRENGSINNRDVNEFERLIDYHDISGYQHSCVISIMRKHWKLFDEELFKYSR